MEIKTHWDIAARKKNVKTMAVNKTQCRMSSARDVAKRQSLWTLGYIHTFSHCGETMWGASKS